MHSRVTFSRRKKDSAPPPPPPPPGCQNPWKSADPRRNLMPGLLYFHTVFFVFHLSLALALALRATLTNSQVLKNRCIHTQERSRFPSRLKYWDIFALVQTSGNISLIAERDDSGHRTAHAWYQALPLFWYARLEWWDRKYQDYSIALVLIRSLRMMG